MVRKIGERFTQTIGNYEIVANPGISEKEEYFIEVLNRVSDLAYNINDMTRFFANLLDEVEADVTDEEWDSLTRMVSRLNYQLENCKDGYVAVYNKLNKN